MEMTRLLKCRPRLRLFIVKETSTVQLRSSAARQHPASGGAAAVKLTSSCCIINNHQAYSVDEL